MNKTRIAAAALAAAAFTLGTATTASAQYAPPPGNISAPNGPIAPGAPFSVTFDSSPLACNWALSPFQGQTAPGATGTSYTVNLTAPNQPGSYTVTALCTWDPAANLASAPAEAGVAKAAPVSLVAAPQTDAYSVAITVGTGAGAGTGTSTGGGALPDTGGARTELLLVGGALVAAGAGATVVARRRHNAA